MSCSLTCRSPGELEEEGIRIGSGAVQVPSEPSAEGKRRAWTSRSAKLQEGQGEFDEGLND